jgi:hypothetical protein
MTTLEIQQEFHRELKALLLKYKAQILLTTETKGYHDISTIEVEFDSRIELYDTHGTSMIPTLELGGYEDGKG